LSGVIVSTIKGCRAHSVFKKKKARGSAAGFFVFGSLTELAISF
jgi:hypothetical protein